MKNEKKRTTRPGTKKPGNAGIQKPKARKATISSGQPKKIIKKRRSTHLKKSPHPKAKKPASTALSKPKKAISKKAPQKKRRQVVKTTVKKRPKKQIHKTVQKRRSTKKKPVKRGRKLKLHPDWPLRAEGYARDGLIDAEIAAKLGIHRSTFYEYMKQFPDFSDAVKRGKAPVDVEVENLLLKRCRGFEYEETEIEYLPGEGKDAPPEITKMKKKTKLVIPDTKAHEFWLKNRKPENWRETTTLDFTEPVKVIISNAFFPKIRKEKKPPK